MKDGLTHALAFIIGILVVTVGLYIWLEQGNMFGAISVLVTIVLYGAWRYSSSQRML